MISQLGSLAALTGLGSGAGLKDPNDLYMGVLASNTVQDGLIKRLGLMDAYHVHKWAKRVGFLRPIPSSSAKRAA